MNRKRTSAIPEPILELQRKLDQFRSGHPRRARLPEVLWQAAAGLAREHGVGQVAQSLRLDYGGLKKRLGEAPVVKTKATAPAFVELIAAHPATVAECVIEFESRVGSKMRIQWKNSAAPDWPSLLRAWREAER